MRVARLLAVLVRVLHAAVLAVGDAFARLGEFGHTEVFVFAGFLAFRGGFVRSGHGAMPPDVILRVLGFLRRIDCGARRLARRRCPWTIGAARHRRKYPESMNSDSNSHVLHTPPPKN